MSGYQQRDCGTGRSGSGCASTGGGAPGSSQGPSAAYSATGSPTAAPGGGKSPPGGLQSVSADNAGCVFTVAEMDAILANPADPHPHVHVNVGTAAAKAANKPGDHAAQATGSRNASGPLWLGLPACDVGHAFTRSARAVRER